MAENAKEMMTDGHEHYSVLKSYPWRKTESPE